MNQLKVKAESLALYRRADEALRLLGINGWWELQSIALAQDIASDLRDPDLYDQDSPWNSRVEDWLAVECDYRRDDPTDGLVIEFEQAKKHFDLEQPE